ncbi:hypothetical protein RJ639_000265 [Escallonia herrerae]|uniref:Uncharacterized protein n=1 Tax=Escallonia herrerae TaxID=1293975 RepID=A0AA89BSQ1_9ASTE|nr:hypothetical protein RJ639_000265 [Escallonia herrerae]
MCFGINFTFVYTFFWFYYVVEASLPFIIVVSECNQQEKEKAMANEVVRSLPTCARSNASPQISAPSLSVSCGQAATITTSASIRISCTRCHFNNFRRYIPATASPSPARAPGMYRSSRICALSLEGRP